MKPDVKDEDYNSSPQDFETALRDLMVTSEQVIKKHLGDVSSEIERSFATGLNNALSELRPVRATKLVSESIKAKPWWWLCATCLSGLVLGLFSEESRSTSQQGDTQSNQPNETEGVFAAMASAIVAEIGIGFVQRLAHEVGQRSQSPIENSEEDADSSSKSVKSDSIH